MAFLLCVAQRHSSSCQQHTPVAPVVPPQDPCFELRSSLFPLQPGFSWSKLGDFEYTSNLQTFLSETNLNTLAKPQTLAQLHSNLEKLEETFCTPEEYVCGLGWEEALASGEVAGAMYPGAAAMT